jgi:RNA polymerase sigma-70 factor (sigma-E family)
MQPSSPRLANVRPCRVQDTGFTDFVHDNTAILLRKAYLLTGSGFAAEELVQDTLVRLYPGWSRVAAAGAPLAYVQRSLANNFRNQWRRRTRHEVLAAAVPDAPAERSIEREVTDRDEVWSGLRTLSPRERAVLVLRFYEGLSDSEIADQLGCRRGTVRSLASRGLARLRSLSCPASPASAA